MGQCETVGDSMAYGNGCGLGLLQELENHREDQKRLITALQAKLEAHQEAQAAKNQILEGLLPIFNHAL